MEVYGDMTRDKTLCLALFDFQKTLWLFCCCFFYQKRRIPTIRQIQVAPDASASQPDNQYVRGVICDSLPGAMNLSIKLEPSFYA